MEKTLNILIIEDSPADFLLVERHLRKQGLEVECVRIDTAEALAQAMDSGRWDLILSDYSVPKLDFFDSFASIQSRRPDLPVILVSGSVGEEQAVELLKLGVWDFILKNNLIRLVPAIERSLRECADKKAKLVVEEALRESEERFRSLMENIPSVAVQGYALDGTVHFWNRASEQLYGYSLEEALGSNLLDLLIPLEMREGVFEAIRQMKESGEPIPSSELLLKRKDGSLVPVFSSHALVNPVSRQPELFCLDIDLTERKQAEEELQKKNIEMEQFIYTVSHDLRSPLVTVKTFMGYLEKDMLGTDQEQLAQDIKYIHSAADKMTMLLDELLELSRIGRVGSPPINVSLREVLDEVLDVLAGAISMSSVEIQRPDIDLMLFGDLPRLCQIWQNLIENAIKYSLDGTAPRIELGVQQEYGETVFFVKDNGIGIAPQYHSKIFGIFEKLNPKSPGAGMGLSLVQRIVDRCGGRVWVESEGDGMGSCFWFTLPQAVVSDFH